MWLLNIGPESFMQFENRAWHQSDDEQCTLKDVHSAVLARLLRNSLPVVLRRSSCEELSVAAFGLVLALLLLQLH